MSDFTRRLNKKKPKKAKPKKKYENVKDVQAKFNLHKKKYLCINNYGRKIIYIE